MLMFIVSFWGLSRLTIERDSPAAPSTSFVDQLIAGFRHLLDRSDLRLLLALTALNGLLGRTIIELLPALSGQVLRGGSAELAVLVAMAGLGSVLGGLLVSRQAADLARLMALVCAAIMLAGLALFSLQWFAGLVGLALWVSMLSVVTTVAGTGSQTLIQLTASAEYRGRVMSVWTMLAMGAPALGAASLGAGVDGFGFSQVAVWTGSAGIVLVASLYARRSRVLTGGDP
jgi:predicted MFS family arabinose efflux permease